MKKVKYIFLNYSRHVFIDFPCFREIHSSFFVIINGFLFLCCMQINLQLSIELNIFVKIFKAIGKRIERERERENMET